MRCRGGGGGRGTCNYDNAEAFGGDKHPSSRDKRRRCNIRRRQCDNQLGRTKGRKGTENERHGAGERVVEKLVEVRWMLQSAKADENKRWWCNKRCRHRRSNTSPHGTIVLRSVFVIKRIVILQEQTECRPLMVKGLLQSGGNRTDTIPR